MAATTHPSPTTQDSQRMSQPGLLLRLEGLTFFLGAIAAYATTGGSAWMFLVLLFVPDISMVGYLKDTRLGALLYNLGHFYALPAAVIALGLAADHTLTLQIGLIWLTHIAMDRMIGYGLKYPTHFKDTHLGRV